MKKNLMMAVVVASSIFVLGACGSKETKEEAATENATEEMAAIDYEHAYICPMACENSGSMEPGQCPVCGMDLKPNPNYQGSTEAAPAPADSGAVMEESHEGHDHEGHSH